MVIKNEIQVTRVKLVIEVAGEVPGGERLAPITYLLDDEINGGKWEFWGTDSSLEGVELPVTMADSIADAVTLEFRRWINGRKGAAGE